MSSGNRLEPTLTKYYLENNPEIDSVGEMMKAVDELYVSKEELSSLLRDLELWKRRLQAMVIADDPIKYLGENI